MQHFKPEEIFGNCENCARYDKNWSCPPRSFAPKEFVTIYEHCYVIGVKFYLSSFAEKEDAIIAYYSFRKQLNEKLLNSEEQFTTLFAGHCELCDECSKLNDEDCRYPEKIRYSLESLGFKVSDIIEEFFDDTLQWDGEKTPDYLYIVAAILTDRTLDDKTIEEIVAQANHDHQNYCSCA